MRQIAIEFVAFFDFISAKIQINAKKAEKVKMNLVVLKCQLIFAENNFN